MRTFLVLLLITIATHGTLAQDKKPFFPHEVKTVDEAIKLIVESKTPEMELFCKVLAETFSSPYVLEKDFTRSEMASYLSKHMLAKPADQLIYATAIPIGDGTMTLVGRFPRAGEIAFCLPLVGADEPLFLGTDGAIIFNLIGKK